MKGFVDLHCHLLPNVDDGPDSYEETVDMLRIAKAEGFTDIVATTHFAPAIPGFFTQVDSATFTRVSKAARGLGITLHPGSEIMLDEQAVTHLKAGLCHPLGIGRHVLLELPNGARLRVARDWMEAFLYDGWVPILAHVERLEEVQAHPEALSDWSSAGCLLQINTGSVTGNWRDIRHRTAKRLIRKKLCDIVSTDAHSSGKRSPLAQEAYRKVSRWVGEAEADRLFSLTPRIVLGLDGKDKSTA